MAVQSVSGPLCGEGTAGWMLVRRLWSKFFHYCQIRGETAVLSLGFSPLDLLLATGVQGRLFLFQIRFSTRGVLYEEFVGIEEPWIPAGMATFWPRAHHRVGSIVS